MEAEIIKQKRKHLKKEYIIKQKRKHLKKE
jgi:hypothetical protein